MGLLILEEFKMPDIFIVSWVIEKYPPPSSFGVFSSMSEAIEAIEYTVSITYSHTVQPKMISKTDTKIQYDDTLTFFIERTKLNYYDCHL